MQVYLGNYNLPTDNDAAYNRQKQTIKDVITTYGTSHIAGITVGNEYMLKYVVIFLSIVSHLIDACL
jgi:exo-beta-1,3-glucanase (GH17 family)